MASSVMRLRLVVRRHGLPEVKIVWPCTSPEDLTVAGLLSEVNEVITLEGTDWGLEDYAVELGDQDGSSFECLHFQQVNKILKHDDQVIIRSLLTDDVRRRRISGREQISSDGKHLLDGVAFGRPWLRAPRGRPAVRLPPRKRPRTTYNLENEGEDDTSGSDTGKQLTLREAVPLDGLDRNSVGVRVTFDNEDVYHYPDYDMDDEEDVENDIDFQLGAENSWTDSDGGREADEDEDEDEDLSGFGEELRLLKSDNAAAAGEDNSAALLEVDEDAPVLPSITINGGEKLLPLRSAFPLTSLSSIEDEYKRQEGDLRRTHQALSMYNDPRLSFDEMMEEALCGPKVTHSTLQQDLYNAREAKNARPLIEVVEGESHVERAARSASTAPPSMIANAAPLVRVLSNPAPAASSNDLNSSSGSSSDGDSSTDSSDESSSDESARKGRTKGPATGSGKRDRSLSSSSDSSDDSSDESSEDEKPSTTSKSNGPVTKKPKVRSVASTKSKGRTPKPAFFPTKTAGQLDPRLFEGDSSSDSSSDSDSSDSDSSSDSDAPPAQLPIVKAGSKGKDVAPRKASEPAASSSKIAQKEAPPGQGLTKTQKRNKRRRLAMTSKNAENNQTLAADEIKESDGQQVNAHPAVGAAADLEARKAALLASIDQEAPEVATTKPPKDEPVTLPAQDTSVDQDVLQKPRMRVDAGAARRMLFGSLGLKNPKTKADEQKIKDGLLEGVKPLKNHRLAEAESKSKPEIQELSSSSSSSDSSDDEDDNSWKNKISYRGVECSQDDVVLSEPPFPFVQRWDPQQQFASRKKRKRKSHAVFDEEYVGDDSMLNNNDDTYNEITMSAPRKRARAESESESESGRIVEVKPTDYEDPLSGSRWSGEDLPEVPTNVESLPALAYGHAKPGMVMTWKQWTLSKTKGWSPNLVNVTALITKVHSDTELTVALAKRDRRADEREYDSETGKRIYSKFEMPGVDEGADSHDDGRREITLIDILDPRVVRPEPFPENTGRDPESTHTRPDQDVSMLGSASSQELGSSASIPSGQPPIDLEHNPFSQLLNVSVSAHGSVGVPKDSSMLEKPDAASTPRPAPKKAPTAKITQPIVVVDDDDSINKTAPTRVGAKAASSPSQSLQTKQALNGANWKSNNDKVSVSSGSQQNRSRAGSKGPKKSPFIHEPSDEEQDSIIPETLLSQKKTPIPSASSRRNSSIESSPIPSLEEVFYTAKATKQTKNPPKSSQASQIKAKSQSSRKGRGSMLDLDEDLTFEMTGVKPSNRKLFTNASQPVKREQSAKPRRSSSASSKKRAPFVLPEGSQVIDLEDASESPFARAASVASNRSAGSNGSSRGSRKRKRPEEVQHTSNLNATAVHSSPAVNTRQRRNSSTAGAKRGRGRPRKNSTSSD